VRVAQGPVDAGREHRLDKVRVLRREQPVDAQPSGRRTPGSPRRLG
jgi:hypothetical protein